MLATLLYSTLSFIDNKYNDRQTNTGRSEDKTEPNRLLENVLSENTRKSQISPGNFTVQGGPSNGEYVVCGNVTSREVGIHNQDLSASQNEPFYQSFSSFFGVDEDFNRFIIKRQLIESESGLRLPLPVLFLFYSFHATTALWFLLNSERGLLNICFISLWVTTHSSLVTVTSRNCLRSLTCKFHIQTILRIS